MELFFNCLLIFSVRIVDVGLGTLGTVLIIKDKRMIGSIIGFVQILLWFIVVREALTIESNAIWIAIAYASGFGVGTYVGSFFEEKLAMGDASIQVITRGKRYDLVNLLRDNGFAVSTIPCQGKFGDNLLLIIEVTRKKIVEVRRIINKIAPDSFVTISDIKKVINGYMEK